MIYEIKRGNTIVTAIRANGGQERSVMAIDRVVMSFTLPAPIEFKRGSVVEVVTKGALLTGSHEQKPTLIPRITREQVIFN